MEILLIFEKIEEHMCVESISRRACLRTPCKDSMTLLLGHTGSTGMTAPRFYSGWQPLPSPPGPS